MRNHESSLREILADSQIAAVAIVMLLFWSLGWAFQALWLAVSRPRVYLSTTVAVFNVPYFSPTITVENGFMLYRMLSYVCPAVLTLAAAWLLSRWVYGIGPLRTLVGYRSKLNGRQDA
jgi:hypothetical protein